MRGKVLVSTAFALSGFACFAAAWVIVATVVR